MLNDKVSETQGRSRGRECPRRHRRSVLLSEVNGNRTSRLPDWALCAPAEGRHGDVVRSSCDGRTKGSLGECVRGKRGHVRHTLATSASAFVLSGAYCKASTVITASAEPNKIIPIPRPTIPRVSSAAPRPRCAGLGQFAFADLPIVLTPATASDPGRRFRPDPAHSDRSDRSDDELTASAAAIVHGFMGDQPSAVARPPR